MTALGIAFWNEQRKRVAVGRLETAPAILLRNDVAIFVETFEAVRNSATGDWLGTPLPRGNCLISREAVSVLVPIGEAEQAIKHNEVGSREPTVFGGLGA